MHVLVDMASSPQYLAAAAAAAAASVHVPGPIDVDSNPAAAATSCTLPDASYSHSDHHTPFSELSHVSPYDASPLIDDVDNNNNNNNNLLTPVSSAASPQLQQHQRFGSKELSPYELDQQQQHHHMSCSHHHHHHHHQQQPTPPHTAAMYSYSDYLGGVASTSSPLASIQPTAIAAEPAHAHHHPHHQGPLLSYLHNPPTSGHHHHHHHHHEDTTAAALPPPPPYFGAYSASSVSVGSHEPAEQHYPSYLHNPVDTTTTATATATITTTAAASPPTSTSLGGIMEDATAAAAAGGGPPSYAAHHRPLAPHMPLLASAPAQQHFGHLPLSSRLASPPTPPPHHRHGRHASVSSRRDPHRKSKARAGKMASRRRESYPAAPTTPTTQQQQQYVLDGAADGGGDDEEVTLDEHTPADGRRLWELRKKYLSRRGNGMWEDIMTGWVSGSNDSGATEALNNENKKTQLKASLQMKIHRLLLKHAQWPERDQDALARAYKRWEESRYGEILRLYEEEMAGRKKAYDWKSQHIEAQLVKMGLEEPERDRDSRARRGRKHQVPARHQARAGRPAPPPPPPPPPPQGRYDPVASVAAYGAYGAGAGYSQPPRAHAVAPPPQDGYHVLAGQIGAQPVHLSDAQGERLVDEILERTPFAVEDDGNSVNGVVEIARPDERMMGYGDEHHHHHHHHQQQQQQQQHGGELLSARRPSDLMMHHHTASDHDNNTMARQACGDMIKESGPYGAAGVGV